MILLFNYGCTFFILFFRLHSIVSYSKESWNLHGKPGEGYYIAVNIGFPPQKFNLLVDTGSSNLAVAGSFHPGIKAYFDPEKSSTFIYNGTSVKMLYTESWWEGYLGKDFVRIPSLTHIEGVLTDLALITRAHGFYVNNSRWQGILGLAYSELAKPKGSALSWFDTLSEDRPKLTGQRFDLQLCGPLSLPRRDTHLGRFSVGTFNNVCPESKFSTSIQHDWYYEVVITSFRVGDQQLDIVCSDFNSPKTIVDSGTSNLLLSGKSYYEVLNEIRRQTMEHLPYLTEEFWLGKEKLCISHLAILNSFPTLTIFLNHNDSSHFGIVLPPVAYMRPYLNDSHHECWVIGIQKAEIGTVLGAVALEGFCVVFDRLRQKISFSHTPCGPNVSLTPLLSKTDLSSCNYVIQIVNGPLIASIIILILAILPLGVAFGRWAWYRLVTPRSDLRVPILSLDETEEASALQ